MASAILYAAMFSASVLSGMLGIGVAFAAVPILGIAGTGLANSIPPVALFLNGVTALFSAVSFARAGYVDWPQCFRLTLVVSIFSLLGALAAEWLHRSAPWSVYFLAIFGAIYLVLGRRSGKRREMPFGMVLLISAPVSAIGGSLGVGPGILLVPAMIILGFNPRSAAAMTSVAVTASSFVSLVPYLGAGTTNIGVAFPLVLVSAVGAYLGGYLSSSRVSEAALRRFFVVVIVALAAYTGISVGEARLQHATGYGGCTEATVLVRTKPGILRDETEEPCASLLPQRFSP